MNSWKRYFLCLALLGHALSYAGDEEVVLDVEFNADNALGKSAYSWIGKPAHPYLRINSNGKVRERVYFGDFTQSEKCRYEYSHPQLGQGWICRSGAVRIPLEKGDGFVNLDLMREGAGLSREHLVTWIRFNAPLYINSTIVRMPRGGSLQSIAVTVQGNQRSANETWEELKKEIYDTLFNTYN